MDQESKDRYEASQAKMRPTWPQGPWSSEPDRVEWRSHGLPCLILRGPLGGLCGYVGVPPEHPAHGKGYDDIDVCVHGGLTYARACGGAICHVPAEGETENVWWLGFDCAHCGDMTPSDAKYGHNRNDVYRDVDYVRCEVESLAEQLAR